MPSSHALLSPSSAHRWMRCTAAPRLEAIEPDAGSDYAAEGTLAHAYCAKKLKSHLGMPTDDEEEEIATLNAYHTGEMDEYTDAYVAEVLSRLTEARKADKNALLLVEIRLDFTDYIPDGFGTSDAVIIAAGKIEVIDFKYGKGVKVSADHNAQMLIYALGAYNHLGIDYDVKMVKMTIIQPRLDSVSEWELSVDELTRWAEAELKPKATEAYAGPGKPMPGDWCRFCKIKSKCTALADICVATADNTDPRLIDPKRLAGDILPRLAMIKAWCASVEEYALEQALAGVEYPGYKLVEGRSVRRITDPDAVIAILGAAGYDEADYLKPATLYGIGDLEKLVGKKKLAKLCGCHIDKPVGKPTLVSSDDKRPKYNNAADDFSGIEL